MQIQGADARRGRLRGGGCVRGFKGIAVGRLVVYDDGCRPRWAASGPRAARGGPRAPTSGPCWAMGGPHVATGRPCWAAGGHCWTTGGPRGARDMLDRVDCRLLRDPVCAISRDPTRSYAIPRDPTRSTRSSAIPRDPTRSHAILRDPTRSHAVHASCSCSTG